VDFGLIVHSSIAQQIVCLDLNDISNIKTINATPMYIGHTLRSLQRASADQAENDLCGSVWILRGMLPASMHHLH
jgi:hypothetical protein